MRPFHIHPGSGGPTRPDRSPGVLRTVLWLLSAAGLLAWQLAAAGPADARAGALDPSFGGGGKVTTDFAGSFDQAFGLVVQADGKLVAAGSAGIAVGQVTTSDFGLARYKQQDGLLDKSFGSRGKVTTDFVGDGDQANALVVQIPTAPWTQASAPPAR